MFICSPVAVAADFDPNNIISDGAFINTNGMDSSAIQRFLVSKGSFLANYSENSRSAAQIIFDAAHGYGDASGSINGIDINYSTGTVNPQVILVTLQKEQSLITATSQNDDTLRKAMGYGCPDSGGCDSAYAGFTKQVENAAWQLRYNYERAQGKGFSDYQVGQTTNFSNTGRANMDVTFANRATASLYRYTPHTYNGNYNFWNLYFNTYIFQDPEYGNSFVTQNAYPEIYQGEAYNFQITLRNSGRNTWIRDKVHLATDRSQDRISSFIREGDGPSGWVSPNRIQMQQESVAPGGEATFSFWMKVPSNFNIGTYREYFRLVCDGISWMEDLGIYWDVTVKPKSEKYHYQITNQNVYPTITSDQSYNFVLSAKNTGLATWQKGQVNLATDRSQDRISTFIREGDGESGWISSNRIQMQESSVSPGQTANFSFWMKAPKDLDLGTYQEYFRLVAEGITWMEDLGIYWDVKVDWPHTQWIAQSSYPTLKAGEKTTQWVEFKNTGNTTWYKDGLHPIHLGTDRSRDRISAFYYPDWLSQNRIAMDQTSVAPGETGRFSYFISVPPDTPAGVYHEYFRLVSEGLCWMEDYGYYTDVTVIP